jgi:hypothetical protein
MESIMILVDRNEGHKQETTMYQVYSYYQGQKWVIQTFATEQEALQVSHGYRVNGTETFVQKA